MRFTAALRAAALVLLAGCSSSAIACTLIGCEDGLAVRFATAPTGAYRVEVWSELRTAPQVFECAAGQPCPSAFFPGFQGRNVTVRVTTAAGARTQEFADVKYPPQYPNGRRCGAACRQALVTVQP